MTIPPSSSFPPPLPGASNPVKRLIDVLGSGAALIVLSPVFLVIAILIRAGSPGPAIFKQSRTGLSGKLFTIYKFRTMTQSNHNAAAVKGDARITPIGQFLRRFSLDEFPQFLNVLQGHMSLVGPRPHAIDHDEIYFVEIENYAERFRMRPGLTGLAQINGSRGGQGVEEIRLRLAFDMDYLRTWSLWNDLKIMILTPARMLAFKAI